MSQKNDKLSDDLPAIVVARLFENEYAPTHNQKWAQLGADESPLIQAALVRAASLSLLGTQPNEAYLRGIADGIAYMKQLDLMRKVRDSSVPTKSPIATASGDDVLDPRLAA